MTLRARLTLWYTIVLAGALLIFGAAVYLLLSYTLTVQIEENLKRAADEILLASRRDMRGVTLPPLDLAGSVYVQVWAPNESGELALLSTNVPSHAGAFDVDSFGATVRTFRTVRVDQIDLRVLSVPVVVLPDNRIVGYLQVANSLEPVSSARELLLYLMIPGGLLAIGLAGAIGWSTAGAALRPLSEVTEAALRINRADDLSHRIPLKGPGEGEVGQLVLAFNATLERLENLFEAQKRFLADVSHELRTPLTTIRGNVDILRRLGAADQEALDAITAETDRMTRMVRDLLLLARAESGRLPLAKDAVELDSLLLEVYKEAQLQAEGRVEIKIGEEDQAQVVGDRDRLKQVLLNLVGNAVEHTPQGGKETLGLKAMNGWARLTVTDTGPGIPPEQLPHIFERFYRVDSARKRRGTGGAGLGLSIAYWITRSHGGRIEVTSQHQEGATFSVWLPAGNQSDQDTAT